MVGATRRNSIRRLK